MIEAFTTGRNGDARKLHLDMLPGQRGLFRNQAAVLTKGCLGHARPAGGGVRGPLIPASEDERRSTPRDLTAGRRQLPG